MAGTALSDPMPGALDGVKVLEIAQVMAIPICGTMLSDMGADVVKLEPTWGDASRYTMQPVLPGESKSFAVLNRGKRSVGLDLRNAQTREALEALVRWADVVLVSVKNEDLAKYKIGYGELRPLNPSMIYLEHVPLGHKGEMGGLGGYDIVSAGIAGLTALIGKERRGQPIYTQPAITDIGTGYLSAMAVCAALYVRRGNGEGQRIESSLLATGMATQMNTAHWFAATDPPLREELATGLAELRSNGAEYADMQRLRERIIRRAAYGNIYYRYYKTKDSFISIGCLSLALQAKFREAAGIVDPRQEPEFDMGTPEGFERVKELVGEVEQLMRTRTTAEWIELLRGYKIPCGLVNFPEEAIEDPQVTENDYMIELDHPVLGPYRTFAPPVRMDATPTRAQGPAPPLAHHTAEVLREVGLEDDAVQRLIEDGVAGAQLPDQ